AEWDKQVDEYEDSDEDEQAEEETVELLGGAGKYGWCEPPPWQWVMGLQTTPKAAASPGREQAAGAHRRGASSAGKEHTASESSFAQAMQWLQTVMLSPNQRGDQTLETLPAAPAEPGAAANEAAQGQMAAAGMAAGGSGTTLRMVQLPNGEQVMMMQYNDDEAGTSAGGGQEQGPTMESLQAMLEHILTQQVNADGNNWVPPYVAPPPPTVGPLRRPLTGKQASGATRRCRARSPWGALRECPPDAARGRRGTSRVCKVLQWRRSHTSLLNVCPRTPVLAASLLPAHTAAIYSSGDVASGRDGAGLAAAASRAVGDRSFQPKAEEAGAQEGVTVGQGSWIHPKARRPEEAPGVRQAGIPQEVAGVRGRGDPSSVSKEMETMEEIRDRDAAVERGVQAGSAGRMGVRADAGAEPQRVGQVLTAHDMAEAIREAAASSMWSALGGPRLEGGEAVGGTAAGTESAAMGDNRASVERKDAEAAANSSPVEDTAANGSPVEDTAANGSPVEEAAANGSPLEEAAANGSQVEEAAANGSPVEEAAVQTAMPVEMEARPDMSQIHTVAEETAWELKATNSRPAAQLDEKMRRGINGQDPLDIPEHSSLQRSARSSMNAAKQRWAKRQDGLEGVRQHERDLLQQEREREQERLSQTEVVQREQQQQQEMLEQQQQQQQQARVHKQEVRKPQSHQHELQQERERQQQVREAQLLRHELQQERELLKEELKKQEELIGEAGRPEGLLEEEPMRQEILAREEQAKLRSEVRDLDEEAGSGQPYERAEPEPSERHLHETLQSQHPRSREADGSQEQHQREAEEVPPPSPQEALRQRQAQQREQAQQLLRQRKHAQELEKLRNAASQQKSPPTASDTEQYQEGALPTEAPTKDNARASRSARVGNMKRRWGSKRRQQ
ncbi:hypothetical protein CYMTET_41150, partial [Cymbomonas tetramitiformis]